MEPDKCLPIDASYIDAEDHHNRIFGQGCDARLNGQSIVHNPYHPNTQAHRTWKNGWRDVDRFWGSEARWLHQELGPVTY